MVKDFRPYTFVIDVSSVAFKVAQQILSQMQSSNRVFPLWSGAIRTVAFYLAAYDVTFETQKRIKASFRLKRVWSLKIENTAGVVDMDPETQKAF